MADDPTKPPEPADPTPPAAAGDKPASAAPSEPLKGEVSRTDAPGAVMRLRPPRQPAGHAGGCQPRRACRRQAGRRSRGEAGCAWPRPSRRAAAEAAPLSIRRRRRRRPVRPIRRRRPTRRRRRSSRRCRRRCPARSRTSATGSATGRSSCAADADSRRRAAPARRAGRGVRSVLRRDRDRLAAARRALRCRSTACTRRGIAIACA